MLRKQHIHSMQRRQKDGGAIIVVSKKTTALAHSARDEKPKGYCLPLAHVSRQDGVREVPLAFVMITAETGRDSEVLSELKKNENVKEVCLTYGAYDLVAKVEAETREKLEEVISQRIRRVDNIRSTLTMMVVDER